MGGSISSDKKESYILSYTNGDKYEGEVVGGVREGYGTYFYHNGDKYEGWWQNNKKHGMGTLFYKDGNLYVGQWKNSEKEGKGTLYFRNGEKYYGEFKNGKKNGKGFLLSVDGNKYIGFFKENKKHGIGVIYYNKNNKVAREEWNNGILVNSKLISESEYNKKIIENKYVDLSFDNYLEDQIKFHQDQQNEKTSNKFKSKFFTLEVAKYFKARIPNNYFDAMQILVLTSHLIYDNPHVTEWGEEEIINWLEGLGLEKYAEIFRNNQCIGLKLLKLNVFELKQTLGLSDSKDIKLILKSIDFLRIFLKLKLDYQDYLEYEKKREIENLNNVVHSNLLQLHREKEKEGVVSNKINLNNDILTNLITTNTNTNNVNEGKISDGIEVHNINENDLPASKEDNSKDEGIVENQEYVLTKMTITKLLLHSLNLSGFNFFVKFEELKFVQKVGEGGFGQVFLGIWNGKYVAIKKFNTKEKHNIKYSLTKFIKEINIISNLRHPNVVLYIGASINKNEYYMISEYIPNGSLFDYLHIQKNKLNENEQLMMAYEIAIALRYLHSRKMTHCDLKSSNILLDENMKIKVSDFGLSRLKNIFSINENKGRIGTSHWMPPEIMKANKYEESADSFSYGMIVWEMVTSEIPYYGLTPNQIIGLVSDCRKIVDIPKEGHPALRKLIKNCLIYEPERRPNFDHIIKFLDGVLKKKTNHDYLTDELALFLN